MDIKLFDDDVVSPTLIDNLTDKVEGLKYSTKLHGGYHIASFEVNVKLSKAWEWITKRNYYRLVIADVKKILFEGRLQDITITASGIEATFYGYYSSLNDAVEITAYNDTADVVIKAALTAHSPDISSTQTNIDAPDITIVSTADSTYLDIKIKVLVEKLLAFGDSSDNPWYFAIWEDRVPISCVAISQNQLGHSHQG